MALLTLLKILALLVFIFWLIGFFMKLFGGLIHILLIVAAVLIIIDFIMDRSDGDRKKD